MELSPNCVGTHQHDEETIEIILFFDDGIEIFVHVSIDMGTVTKALQSYGYKPSRNLTDMVFTKA